MGAPGDQSNSSGRSLQQLREEAYRVHEKLEQTTDEDIRSALQLKLDQLNAEITAAKTPKEAPALSEEAREMISSKIMDPESAALAAQFLKGAGDTPTKGKLKKTEEPIAVEKPEPEIEVEEELPEPSTPEQIEKAENLLRQSRLAKQRGQGSVANQLLQEAIDAAPGSAVVLEAVGDDYAERKKYKEAIKVYARAMRLAPGNRGLETKHANLIFQAKVGRMSASSDGMLLNRQDNVANAKIATLMSIFIPGAGHIVLGESGAGFGFLGAWVVCLVWILVRKDEVLSLMASMGIGHGARNAGAGAVMIPIIIAVIVYMSALFGCAARAKGSTRRRIDRPQPPVDLPFD